MPLDDLLAGARWFARLPGFLRRPVREGEARAIVAARIARREADALSLIRRAVYANPASPYRRLLEHAGCGFADLAALVRREGLEGALARLYAVGVYLTVDEMKGHRPIVRGSLTLRCDPVLLRNPLSSVHLIRQSSGSRGDGITVGVSLDHVRDCALNTRLTFDARGGRLWAHGFWTVPGTSAVVQTLHLHALGGRPARAFLQVDPASPGLHPRYIWSMRALRLSARLAGISDSPARIRPGERPAARRPVAE